jgi:transcriptional regulator with XRE-family HTH domain
LEDAVVRGRAKKAPADKATPPPAEAEGRMDVNAVVSYNLKAIREHRKMTQQEVAAHLASLTGHLLPQASISAMEQGFQGDRRRRFDAHELYLLSIVFGVPIVYFFLPPPGTGQRELADSRRPVSELYVSLLGHEHQLAEFDARLAQLKIDNPDEVEDLAAAIFDGREEAAQNWHAHYRSWRKKRLAEIARTYGDQLDEVAEFLAKFANQITELGPTAYLQATAHKPGEDVDGSVLEPKGEV